MPSFVLLNQNTTLLNEKENVIYLVTTQKELFLMLIYLYLVCIEYSLLIKSCILWAS